MISVIFAYLHEREDVEEPVLRAPGNGADV